MIETPGGYECGVCGVVLQHKGSFKRHMKDQHLASGMEKFDCSICGRIYKSKNSADKHMYRDHRDHVLKSHYHN